ncbi:MAG: metallopeptidase family protein [Chthoniobacterales bacterium]|jgi:predicted Zn-dependent protease with MMP-like domain|nr:metallopeptidase family protein [Chthoniobacterales bacterium]
MDRASKARKVVVETLHRLPAALRDAARQVPVCFEDWPDDALVEDGLDPGILGLFVGAPRHEHVNDPGPPPQIILYLENILDECEEAGTGFPEEVRRTYLHELGHYLGLDEDALAARDLD